jgi:hypothetical protein
MAHVGPTHTSPSLGFTAWCKPTLGSFKPRNPTKWRAVCGKTARTVRREGESVPDSPYLDLNRLSPSLAHFTIELHRGPDIEQCLVHFRRW